MGKYAGPPGPKSRAQRMAEWSANTCPNLYMTVGEVAALLGWSGPRTLYLLKKMGVVRKLPGRQWYFVPKTAVREAFPELWQEWLLTRDDTEDDD